MSAQSDELRVIKSGRSTTYVDILNNTVRKYPSKWKDIVFQREVNWLKKIGSSNRFPSLIGFDEKECCIITEYCGELIDKDNCPLNWESQMSDILAELKRFNCSHNDIKEREILVLNGHMILIDFGWATEIGESIPEDWPEDLGGIYKFDRHNFDDEFSFRKVMLTIIGNPVDENTI